MTALYLHSEITVMFNEAYITTIRFGLRVWFKSRCFIILFSWISILLTSKNLHCSRTNQIYKLNFAYPCIFSKCSIAIYSFQWYFFLFILICIEVQLNCLNYVHALYLPMYRTNRGFPMHFHIVFPPFQSAYNGLSLSLYTPRISHPPVKRL